MENAQNNNIVKFEVGKSYYYRFACSYDTVVTVTVIKRTAKTITIDDDGEKLTRKVYILDGAEHAAIAHYSMAPTLDATRTQEALEASQKAAKKEGRRGTQGRGRTQDRTRDHGQGRRRRHRPLYGNAPAPGRRHDIRRYRPQRDARPSGLLRR